MILRLALKNLSRKPERSFLTAFGVFLAVACTISLLSIAQGISNRAIHEIGDELVQLYVVPRERLPLSIGGISLSFQPIPQNVFETLLQDPKVLSAAPVVEFFPIVNGRQTVFLGFDSSKFPLFFPPSLQPENGSLYGTNASEITLGAKLASDLRISVGDSIKINGEDFKVSGILNATGGMEDSFGFMPLEQALSLSGEKGYSEIWLQLKDPSEQASVQREIQQNFPFLQVLTKEEYLASTFVFIKFLLVLEWSLSLVGILIALAASTNTMLISTYERMKEYGILRGIGASRQFIFALILWESLLVSFLGGIAGIVAGILGARSLDFLLSNLLQFSIPFTKITPILLLEGLSIAIGIGLISAWIPAVIASKQDILKAIRWE
jgi:putative ABC transport system permease protein